LDVHVLKEVSIVLDSVAIGETDTGGPALDQAVEREVRPFVAEPDVQVAVATLPSEAEEIIALFEQVARAERWQPDGELRAHVGRSTYFGLWTTVNEGPVQKPGHRGQLVGGLQLVRPEASGRLASHRVWPELPAVRPDHAAHIAVLAVHEDWRGKKGGLFWLLTAAMWNHCVREGIRELYLEATPRTMRCYERLGWPLRAIGPLREHWGEDCYPCSLGVRDVAGALAERAVRSDAYRRVLSAMVDEHATRVAAIQTVGR
jgi:GNAT superfamily N-acetyltransferase